MKILLTLIYLLIVFGCTNENGDQAVYIKTTDRIIRVETKNDIKEFDELLSSSKAGIDINQQADLPDEVRAMIDKLKSVQIKNKAVSIKNKEFTITDGKDSKKFLPQYGFLVLLFKAIENFEKNKLFFSKEKLIEFDEFELKDTKKFKGKTITDTKKVSQLKDLITKIFSNKSQHLSYLDFSKNLSLKRYEVILKNKEKTVGIIRLDKSLNIPIKINFSNHSLTYKDDENSFKHFLQTVVFL